MDNIAAGEQAKSPSERCMAQPFARCSIGRCRVSLTGRRSVPRTTTRPRQESARGHDGRPGVLQKQTLCVGGKQGVTVSLNSARSRVSLSATGSGSGTRFVHGFVHEMRRDSLRRWRRRGLGQMLAVCPPRSTWMTRDVGDARRMAHNPEVEGSNPSLATKARGPFSNRERAFCMWVADGYVNAGLTRGRPPEPGRPCSTL